MQLWSVSTAAQRQIGYCGAGVIHPKGTAKELVRSWADRDQKVVAEDYVARKNGVEPGTAIRLAFEFDSIAEFKKAHLDLIKIVDGKNVSVDEIKPDSPLKYLYWSALSESERSRLQSRAALRGWIVCAVLVVIVCAIIYRCHSVLSCKSDPHMDNIREPGYCTDGT